MLYVVLRTLIGPVAAIDFRLLDRQVEGGGLRNLPPTLSLFVLLAFLSFLPRADSSSPLTP